MIETPEVLEMPSRKIACIHITVPREEIRQVMGPGLGELQEALAAQHMEPAGPWFTHHFQRPADIFDFEICMPVEDTVRASGRVKNSELPGATVARAVYRGPLEGLAAAWGELRDWIGAQGHIAAEDLWEVYVADKQTDLYQPLVR